MATLTVAPPASQAAPVSAPSGALELSWSASPTATAASVRYYVLRRPAAAETYASVAGPLAALSYVDDPGSDGVYEYVIRAAVSGFTADGVARTGVSDRTPPSAVSLLVATPGALDDPSTVELSWSAASDMTTGVAQYMVSWDEVLTPLSPCPMVGQGNYPNSIVVDDVTSLSLGLPGLLHYYCFFVVAIDGAGNASAASDVAGPTTSR